MDYKKYAKVLNLVFKNKSKEGFELFFNNFISLLKRKKKVKLLPEILSELRKIQTNEKKEKGAKLILKDKNLLDKYQKEFSRYSNNFNLDNLEIEENKNIIGGYILKNKKYKVDNSFKKKLLNLYNEIES